MLIKMYPDQAAGYIAEANAKKTAELCPARPQTLLSPCAATSQINTTRIAHQAKNWSLI